MAGLSGLVASAMKIANKATGGNKGLQVTIQHQTWLGQHGTSSDDLDTAVAREALVEEKRVTVRTQSGQEVTSKYVVNFLQPVEIALNDAITLPDGTICAVISVGGLINKDTGKRFYSEVLIG